MADVSQTRKEVASSTRSGARRAGESAISFLQSFFLCGYTAKEKSVKEVLVSKNSSTDYSDCLVFIHFFFDEISAKKKFPKRNAEYRATRPVPAPLLVESHL